MLSYLQVWYQKFTLRNHTSKEINQIKELSIKELRDMILKGVVIKLKHQVCYARIIEIANEREDIEKNRNKSTAWLCYKLN